MQRSKSTLHQILNFLRDSARSVERKVLMSKHKNRGISVTSRDKRDRQSIRSNSKIKLTHPSTTKLSARHPSTTKHPQRHIRTIASINDSMNFSKRLQTQNSPMLPRGKISSLFMQNNILERRLANHANKQNKPSLNLMRKNRFR